MSTFNLRCNSANQVFLTKRSECLNRILLGEVPIRIDDVSLTIDGPEYGCLELSFVKEGYRPLLIEASDVYPPFSPLRDWLKDMLNFTAVPSKSFILDCESYNVMFSYDFLGHIKKDGIYEPVAFVQIEDDTDSKGQCGDYEYLLQLIVPIRSFVATVYYTLKNHIVENRRVYRREWELPSGTDFDIRKLLRSFVSKEIEEVLEAMNSHPEDLGHWPLIQIK